MVPSQRGENTFRWFKEAQTQKKHWTLSVVIKMAFVMSQDSGDKAEEKFFKGVTSTQRRRVYSGKKHRMFANVRGGEVTEYAFKKASCDEVIVLSTTYSVELTLTEEVTEDLTVLTFNVCVVVSKTVQCLTEKPDNSQESALYNDAEDYCGGGAPCTLFVSPTVCAREHGLQSARVSRTFLGVGSAGTRPLLQSSRLASLLTTV